MQPWTQPETLHPHFRQASPFDAMPSHIFPSGMSGLSNPNHATSSFPNSTPMLNYEASLKHFQLENSELRKVVEELRSENMELKQALEKAQDDARATREKLNMAAIQTKGNANAMDAVRVALRKYTALYNPFPPEDREFYDLECPTESDYLTNYEMRYKDSVSEKLGLIAELYSVFPSDDAAFIVSSEKAFRNLVMSEAKSMHSIIVKRAHDTASKVFCFPEGISDVSLAENLKPLLNFVPGSKFSKFAPVLYPPEVRSLGKPNDSKIFMAPEIPRLLKAILFGAESLKHNKRYPKPETMGIRWGVTSITHLPISSIAVGAILAVFLVSGDPEFISRYDEEKPVFSVAGICYPELFQKYKKLVYQFQSSRPRHFNQLISIYDKIIFDHGIKATLHSHNQSDNEEISSGDELDFGNGSDSDHVDGWANSIIVRHGNHQADIFPNPSLSPEPAPNTQRTRPQNHDTPPPQLRQGIPSAISRSTRSLQQHVEKIPSSSSLPPAFEQDKDALFADRNTSHPPSPPIMHANNTRTPTITTPTMTAAPPVMTLVAVPTTIIPDIPPASPAPETAPPPPSNDAPSGPKPKRKPKVPKPKNVAEATEATATQRQTRRTAQKKL